MNKKISEEEALKKCYDRLKPSIIGYDNYNKFRQYKKRAIAGNESAKEKLLNFFGFEYSCVCIYDKDKDQSLKG